MSTTITRNREIIENSRGTPIHFSMTVEQYGKIEDLDIADGTTDLVVEFPYTLARIKYVLIQTNQDLSVNAFNGASAGATLTVKANQPVDWAYGDPYALPLLGGGLTALTKLQVSNASGEDAKLNIRIGYDATP